MKRVIVITVLSAALIIGARVNAQDFDSEKVKAEAGTTPNSEFLYNLDIFAENAWQNIIGIFSRRAQLSYLEKRIQEREAEALQIASEKGPLSDETLNILGRKQDYRLKIADIALQDQDYGKIKEIQERGWKFDFEYAKYIVKELDNSESLKKRLRDEIAVARKERNAEKLADIVRQMEEARKKEDDILIRNKQVVEASEMASEKLENIMTPAERAELLFQRIAEEKKATDVRWEKLLNDLDKAKVERMWKKIFADLDAAKKMKTDDEAKAFDDSAKNIQKSLHDARMAAEKGVAAKLAKEDREDKKVAELPEPPAPPKPPAPKPELKLIPSETVVTEPLNLTYYQLLTGEVGKYFSAYYSATGGLPPYHFQLESGTGFPPIGIVLAPNGLLSGYPKSVGGSKFSVCVVDMTGVSVCGVTIMTIEPKEEEWVPPAPEPQPAPQPTPPPPSNCGAEPVSTCGAEPTSGCYEKCGGGTAPGSIFFDCQNACLDAYQPIHDAWQSCKLDWSKAHNAYIKCKSQ
ncbi:MAG: hypothetical protein HZB99_04750 [Candidatus Harrisonbacteria bacterium]|nr:hypothetical protein [Candidatus Harrisonbacteria bacterium]